MIFKYFVGLVAIALMLIYLVPPVIKLKEIELGIVILIGLAMMAVDLWQSFKSKDDD
jgi:uncharacterized membrane protein YqjE